MNHTRRLRGLRPHADRPLPHFVRARGEEAAQVQRFAHRNNDFWQRALSAKFLAFLLGFGLRLKSCEALLEGDGHGDDSVPGSVLVDPGGDFGEVLVFLPEIVLFRKVDQIDDGLGRKEEEGVENFDLDVQMISVSMGER